MLLMLICLGCQWQLKPSDATVDERQITIQRYDRIESLYLSTGDYSALQQMNANYPKQTRTLIEDVLRLGHVNDPGINVKFLHFFQDSTLQIMLTDVQEQYADLDDLDQEFTAAFQKIKELLPSVTIPEVYTQIGSFDQSIIVGNNTLGICLDKYLGRDYPFYRDHYSENQRKLMERSMIVPDGIAFYLLSLFPHRRQGAGNALSPDSHMSRIHWVVRQVTGRDVFDNSQVKAVEEYMRQHPSVTVQQLLCGI